MSETAQFQLPLLAPSQAQKHVTVNEALTRLDALANLRIVSERPDPPADPAEGDVHAVTSGASGLWAGQEGRLALRLSGAWVFVSPRAGWSAWHAADARAVRFDGTDWIAEGAAMPLGAITTTEFEHILAPGAYSDTTFRFPANSVMFGVGARVIEEVTGTLNTLSVGHDTDVYWFGWGFDTAAGTEIVATPSWPARASSERPVRFSPDSGTIAGGRLLVRVQYYVPSVPA
ncbi:DUF2793 domain-containing protein [Anianabacter salinae]|uniref:DUF2793 domain-containing protein n=1 Tax=Anianabacter salinae TaxID=2851023 RepID=UPI00225E410F|nr:DUF2793 domain-containing protein [Anianabacter salinae]MBV0912954.1 DUF2793 domain-containing protein [Anianabacter salinae]